MQNLEFTFDAVGNLKARTDHIQGFTESFSYDNLNRLLTVTGPASKSYSYDAAGNLAHKSDVGDYVYDGGGGAGPHAVTAISVAGVTQASFSYDANGNLTQGAGRNLSYTSFNKSVSIIQDSGAVAYNTMCKKLFSIIYQIHLDRGGERVVLFEQYLDCQLPISISVDDKRNELEMYSEFFSDKCINFVQEIYFYLVKNIKRKIIFWMQ